MNKLTDCSICSEGYDTKERVPRGCSSCGNNVCEMCLISIQKKSGSFDCPFCKAKSPSLWAKNLPFMHMLEDTQGSCLVCTPHKRKIMTLCCSPQCKLPAGICDKADCSRLHKEYGTNNLPMSFINDQQEDNEALGIEQCIAHMHRQVEKTIVVWLQQRKNQASKSVNSMIRKSREDPDAIAKMPSSQLATIRSKIMNQEHELKEDREKTLTKAQASLTNELIEVLKGLRISYDDIMQEQPSPKPASSPPSSSSMSPVVPKHDDHNYLFELIEKIIGGKFRNQLLFDSMAHATSTFKSRIGGQANLLSRIELVDGTVFGSYTKVAYPAHITGDRMYADPNAFVYWQNERTFFEATPNSKSQFDVAKNFLFSVGNTYHWDGFWFEKDLQVVNPGRNTLTISSDQYTGLFINFTSNAVRSVKMFRLIF